MSDRAITIYCGLMLAMTAFSIDITLPFFGEIRDAMGASDEATHAIITLNIFCMGIGQLFFGPFSDRYGRRPAMAVGLSLFFIGALVCYFADNITVLLIGRALQGLGGAVTPVTARSIMRDRHKGKSLAKNMAIASGIIAAGPIAAPLVGVSLVAIGGDWRIVFVAMALFGLGLLITLVRLPETLAQTQNDALTFTAMLRNSKAIIGNRQSRHFMLVNCWAGVIIISIISGLPPMMEHEYGVTGKEFAFSFATIGVGIILAQFANHRLIDRIGVVPSAILGSLLPVAGFALVTVFAAIDHLSAYSLIAFIFIFSLGNSIVLSNSISLALEPHGEFAGFAAAAMGAFGQFFRSIVATVLLWVSGPSLFNWGASQLAVCLIIFVSLFIWQRHSKKDTTGNRGE